MTQLSIDEIVADLHSYVAGRGRKNNFMFRMFTRLLVEYFLLTFLDG